MILVFHRRLDGVLGAQVPHEDRDDQGIGLITGHLHKAGGADIGLIVSEVAEVLHLEEAPRIRAGDPGCVATPGPCGGERLELLVDALEALLGKPV
jgi:hypothetical protein